MDVKVPPTLGQIAWCFMELGLRSFGGVGAQVRDVLVRGRGWVDDAEFAEVLGLGQVLPGGNVLNASAMLGDRWRGWPGAITAVTALTVPSTCIAIVLLSAATWLASNPIMTSIERTIVAAAAGSVTATGLRLLVREVRRK
jgi:chromate transporter